MIHKLVLYRGDDLVFEIPFVRDGAPINITGASIRFAAKYRDTDANVDAVISKSVGSGIVITDAAGGIATVTIAEADTAAITMTTSLDYDIELTESNGTRTTTEKGTMLVVMDVSH